MTAVLRPLRTHEILHRSLYRVDLPDAGGRPVTWTVEVDVSGDWEARLYRDGHRAAAAELPAALPVPGGRIEVDAGLYGVTRVHLVTADGEHRLAPVPGTLEHRRARLAHRRPGVSRAIAATAVVILAVNLVLAAPQALEILTSLPRVAEHVGTFVSPVTLPAWLNTTLLVAGALAAVERVLTWRRNRVLDAETLWTSN
ncbi:hypothetical protein WIS52_25635 [Pseudonocardia nematodicida]|uniref:Uncharacterized protein n=1 Tax=Pseudonocardia nematodicida TaxID=1206997 RepID=A0ABV1KHD6_9PSEU